MFNLKSVDLQCSLCGEILASGKAWLYLVVFDGILEPTYRIEKRHR